MSRCLNCSVDYTRMRRQIVAALTPQLQNTLTEWLSIQEAVVEENSKYPPMKDKCPLRILGGVEVDIEEVPYQIIIVRVPRKGECCKLICGGSIITREHVLTAAHCFTVVVLRNLRFYRVIAGTSESMIPGETKPKRRTLAPQGDLNQTEVWRKISDCFKHKFFATNIINHDLAVLKLEYPYDFSRAVQPIPMLKPSHGIKLEEEGLCAVSGFGRMENSTLSKHLRMVCVPFVTRKICKRVFGNESITESQFCAGDYGKDSCQGDSGGPITYKGYLIGIVSYGGRCGATPGVYTKLSAYTSGDPIPFALNHCVTLSLNVIGIVVFFILNLCTLFNCYEKVHIL